MASGPPDKHCHLASFRAISTLSCSVKSNFGLPTLQLLLHHLTTTYQKSQIAIMDQVQLLRASTNEATLSTAFDDEKAGQKPNAMLCTKLSEFEHGTIISEQSTMPTSSFTMLLSANLTTTAKDHSLVKTHDILKLKTLHCKGLRCAKSCSCACHEPYQLQTSRKLQNVSGLLSVGLSGLPVFRHRCDEPSCRRRSTRLFKMTYSFPTWA